MRLRALPARIRRWELSRNWERPLVYLAAPYIHPHWDVVRRRMAAVNLTAARMMQAGIKVFSPLSHSDAIAQAGDLPKGWEYWAEYDQTMLRYCHALYVLQLEGWDQSRGVTEEIRLAKELDLRIWYLPNPFTAMRAQATAVAPRRKP